MLKRKLKEVLCLSLIVFGVLLFTISDTTYAQSAVSTGVPFLLIGPNSRFAGMGETGTALADDASAMYWNPAGLAFQNKGTELNFTHSAWLPGLGIGDLFYDYLAGKKYIKSINGTVGASLTYLNIGDVVVTDEFGIHQPEKDYRAFEIAFAIGYATKMSQSLGVGITSRFIYSKLAPNNFKVANEKGIGTGITASIDLSALWKPQEGLELFRKKFSMGINLSNLGPKISYVDGAQADPLPTQLRIGFGYEVLQSEFNSLTITADFSKLLVNKYVENGQPKSDAFYEAMFTSWKGGIPGIARSFQSSIGAEYWYGSPRLIALRAGYFYEDPSYGNRKFITMGAGLRYSLYGFDFSYISSIEEDHPLANTLRFGLVADF